jgi:lipopolysaccharide transport system ATP-binding protein
MTQLQSPPALPAGAVEVRSLVFDYPLYRNLAADRFRAVLSLAVPGLRPESRRVLDGVSFSIKPGEVVGLVGRNGAGKTSLLRVISGLVAPTAGSVDAGGRIMALLAMGVGFRPMLTGRENLVYSGLLVGLEKRDILALIPEIADFSELGEALDQPLFTYSSGMRARLAFSLAASVPADVTILDETLAAGDGRFMAKCYRRLREIQASGRTILLVSHHLGEIVRLASRVMVLEKGRLAHDGEVVAGLRLYERLLADTVTRNAGGAKKYGELEIAVKFYDRRGEETKQVTVGQRVTVRLSVRSERDLGETFVVIRINDLERGQLCSYLMPSRWQALGKEGEVGHDNLHIGRGETTVDWDIPQWISGEGCLCFDVYLGPATDLAVVDLADGQFWNSVARLMVSYDNHLLKGANTVMEIPVQRVEVRRSGALPGAPRDTAEVPSGQGG